MRKFRKKPVEIEAEQYTYPASAELRAWMGASAGIEIKDRHIFAKGEMQVHTLEDGHAGQVAHIATEGDWIIKGVHGEFYAVKPDIFAVTYEEVPEA